MRIKKCVKLTMNLFLFECHEVIVVFACVKHIKGGVRRWRREELRLSALESEIIRKEHVVRRKKEILGDLLRELEALLEGVESVDKGQG